MEKNAESPLRKRRRILAVSAPLLVPLLLCPAIILGMFLFVGWFLVGMTFFTAASALVVGVLGIVGLTANAARGTGPILLTLGVGLMGFALVYPLFRIALEYARGFSVLSGAVIRRSKSFLAKARNHE